MENIIVLLSVIAVICSALSGFIGAWISNSYNSKRFKQELNYKYKLEIYSKICALFLEPDFYKTISTNNEEFMRNIALVSILGSDDINRQINIVLGTKNFQANYKEKDETLIKDLQKEIAVLMKLIQKEFL